MRPTRILFGGGGGGPIGKYGVYLGTWGNLGSPVKQRGIITHGLAPNRQDPFANWLHDATFNTYRRVKSHIFYWLPTFMCYYFAYEWAKKTNHYYNSKAGRAELAALEGEEDEDDD